MNYQYQIPIFFQETRYENLPRSVVHQAKRGVLDTVGCILAGISSRMGKAITEISALFLQQKGASILGIRRDVFPIIAALGNGFLANALDADDGCRMARGHPGGVIIPAALAAAELRDCDGKCFIESIVVGYEIGLRAGLAINSGQAYFGSANWATFGATAAAAKLLNLEGKAVINALGITEMHTPTCQPMAWIKSKQIPMIKEGMGWAAATGLASALLAKGGMTGCFRVFSDKRWNSKLASLGTEFEILKLYFKKYPSCRWTHPALDNLLAIMRENNLDPADIISIRVKTFREATLLDSRSPQTTEEAQYSLPFVLAAALVDGSLGPEQMNESKLGDQMILEMAQKVHISVDPAAEKRFPRRTMASVEVLTRQGLTLNKFAEKTKGDWDMPLCDLELEEKFLRFSTSILPNLGATKVLNVIKRLEEVQSMKAFLESFF